MHAGTVDLPKAARAARAALDLLEGRLEAESAVVAAALGARVRADLFLGEGFDGEAAERARTRARPRPRRSTPGSCSSSDSGSATSTTSTARGRTGGGRAQARDEGDESSLANILLNRSLWRPGPALAMRLSSAGQMSHAFEQLGVDVGIDPGARTSTPISAGSRRCERAGRDGSGADRRDDLEPLLGLAELAAGEPERRPAPSEAIELDRVDFREPAVWRVDGDAIEAAVAVGDLDRAERLAPLRATRRPSRIPWSLAVSRPLPRSRARRAGSSSRGRGARRALVEHERSPVPFERARTLLVRDRSSAG